MISTTIRTSTIIRAAVLVAVSAVAFSACSSTTDASQSDSTTVTDPWVKAVDEGMTAAFGVISNSSDQDVTVVSASADVAPKVQLHETTMSADGGMSMSPIEGGFVIPAGSSLTLEPGSFHIMLVGVTAPIAAGDGVDITLTFSDDSTIGFQASAKEFTGADEDYAGGEDAMDGMAMESDS